MTGVDQTDTNLLNDTASVIAVPVVIDSDGDGCSDFLESLFGTNPADDTDCPQIYIDDVQPNGVVTIRFHSLSGFPYTIEASTNLYQTNGWQQVGVTNGSQPFTTFIDTNNPAGTERKYYRVNFPSPPILIQSATTPSGSNSTESGPTVQADKNPSRGLAVFARHCSISPRAW